MRTAKESGSSPIARLNDALREAIPLLPRPHRLVLTDGVAALPNEKLSKLFQAIKSFTKFESENDPYDEHDFITVDLDNDRFFMKIDYYDKDLKYFEENGVRLFTLMFANEY